MDANNQALEMHRKANVAQRATYQLITFIDTWPVPSYHSLLIVSVKSLYKQGLLHPLIKINSSIGTSISPVYIKSSGPYGSFCNFQQLQQLVWRLFSSVS